MFIQALGIGLGIGIVHAACLFALLLAARSNARAREDTTLELMRERNGLDRQKVAALDAIGKLLHQEELDSDEKPDKTNVG